jgi:hypothetical protein
MMFVPPFNFFPTGPPIVTYGTVSYTLTLEIGDQESNSTLSDLSATNATLSPAFAPATTLYSSTIPFPQTQVNLASIFGPLQYATMSVNGGTPTAINSGTSVAGVPVGLKKMPRVPAIYERKTRRRKYEEDADFCWWVDNYRSASQRGDFFEQEGKEGLMVKMRLADAQAEWRDLRVAAQGAILKDPEGSTFRVVHAGTHGVQVNLEIRLRDQARMPTAAEATALMEMQSRGRPGAHFQLLMDVAKAHRRVKHRRQDWGSLAASR